jgi:putative endonuclease
VLKSLKDSGYYIGQTENIEARLKKHNMGQVKSTKNRRPFIVVKSEIFNSRSEAMQREYYLKRLKGGNEFRNILISD